MSSFFQRLRGKPAAPATPLTADGLLAKSGGQVVKNVAGYDLSKLLTGSFGSLAVIVTATFKLSPLPAASRTLVAAASDAETVSTGHQRAR